MKYNDAHSQLLEYRKQIAGLRAKMRDVVASTEPEEVPDYQFTGAAGSVRLSDLFGEHDDLIVIHNMGVSCSSCTLWADGYNGIHRHVIRRAGFAVTSPDSPDVQQRIARNRGWVFPMVSHMGNTFAADMGYRAGDGGWRPGVSVFRRDAHGKIVRVSDTAFSPGDDFCTLWHFFDLLPGGAAHWSSEPAAAPSCCGQR